METVRADKWLWSIRAFKTRAEAAKACQAGRIRRLGRKLKASSTLKIGDRIFLPAKGVNYTRELEVLELIEMRVGAAEASACYQEHTDPSIAEEARKLAKEDRMFRKEGSQGRMTKRDRRIWEETKGGFFH